MITIIRMVRLWQLRTKWHLALYQFIDKQATELMKNPEQLEKKIMPYLAEIIHSSVQSQKKDSE